MQYASLACGGGTMDAPAFSCQAISGMHETFLVSQLQ